MANFGTSLLLGVRARDGQQLINIGVSLVCYAAALVIAQSWIPQRHSQFSDFVAGSLGAALGLLAALVISAVSGRLSKTSNG